MSIHTSPRRRINARLLLNLLMIATVGVLAVLVAVGQGAPPASGTTVFPRSADLEELTGVRFSRVVEVGDGGLLTLDYVVIDPEKATQFQSDRDHPPRLASEERDGGTQRASIMRAGHAMTPGHTYYLVYQNTAGAIRSGELVSIKYGGLVLRHVPVL